MSSTMRRGTSAKLSQNSSTMAAIMRLSAVAVGRFSSRHMVGCEHKARPLSGRRPTAILKAGSLRRASQSLASGYPAAISSTRKRIISATVWWTRSGALGSAMQRASRSAIPSRRSMSASGSTPASEVSRPPSKATRNSLPAIGEERKADRWCCSMAHSTAARDRLHLEGEHARSGGIGMDVGAWLRGLGLGQYEQAFRDNDVDADVLPELTADELRELGVTSLGHRKRLLAAITALRAARAAPAAAVPPPDTSADTPPAVPPGEAERRQLTVMFVDLVGSTALSARLDPEEMGGVLRAYQNAVAGEVARFEGHVAKFMGDGVLAYFGWPRAHEDEPERAVRAALAVVAAVHALPAPAGERLSTRVGIATGLVLVGELTGEGEARERSVVGDTPNLAARLQVLASPSGVVVAPSTRRLLGSLFELEELEPRALNGLAEPVVAFAVLGERAGTSRFEAR